MGCGASKASEGEPPFVGVGESDVALLDADVTAGKTAETSRKLEDVVDGPLTAAEIHARKGGSKATETYALTPSTRVNLRYAVLSQRGYYPEDMYKANQDSYIVLPNFHGVTGDILLGVFDGHGKDGDACSRYVRDRLPKELIKHLEATSPARLRKKGNRAGAAFTKSFLQLNKDMINQGGFDADYSGTTAVTALFLDGEIHIANVGDSRVIIGQRRGHHTVAVPLSHDQTPFRADERARVKEAGAKIRTGAHVAGEVKYTKAWEDNLGIDDEENSGEPPRLYAQHLQGPGCAFTRSIGDAAGEEIGVFAEPELVSKELREQDQFICLASDGVWEFISSQRVVEMVLSAGDPLKACHAVIAESYRLWLQFDVRTPPSNARGHAPSLCTRDTPLGAARHMFPHLSTHTHAHVAQVRTDDITMILAWFDDEDLGAAPRAPTDEEVQKYEELLMAGVAIDAMDDPNEDGITGDLNVIGAGTEQELKPVRRALSAEMRAKIAIDSRQMTSKEAIAAEKAALLAWKPVEVEKSAEELGRIELAVRANVIFDRLNEAQRRLVNSVMTRVTVKKGDVIIRQGDDADSYYIVDSGTYAVTIGDDPASALEVLSYEPNTTGGANPCFGELALLYSKPRAANVVARTDGLLWSLDRLAFHAILTKSSESSLVQSLRSVPMFRPLPTAKLRQLAALLHEVQFPPGSAVATEGDTSEPAFFVISDGHATVTKKSANAQGEVVEKFLTELGPGDYFGERTLLDPDWKRHSNVTAATRDGKPLVCLQVSKAAFEGVLGPLTDLITADSEWRFHTFLVRQRRKVNADLSKDARDKDFTRQGVTVVREPVEYALVQAPGREDGTTTELTLKTVAKGDGGFERFKEETNLAALLCGESRFVPLAITTFESPTHLCSVMPTRVAISLRDLLDAENSGCMPPAAVRYYGGCAALVLEHLHAEMPAFGGVVLRDLSPDSFVVDANGCLQLLDLRFAFATELAPMHEFVGFAHYQAPEVIAGEVHGKEADYWGLGCLLYELAIGTGPWLTGDPIKDSELGIYVRISQHRSPMRAPAGTKVEKGVMQLLNALLHETPNKRIGCGAKGPEEVRSHAFFKGVMWDDLGGGDGLEAPHKAEAAAHVQEALKAGTSGVLSPPMLAKQSSKDSQGETACLSSADAWDQMMEQMAIDFAGKTDQVAEQELKKSLKRNMKYYSQASSKQLLRSSPSANRPVSLSPGTSKWGKVRGDGKVKMASTSRDASPERRSRKNSRASQSGVSPGMTRAGMAKTARTPKSGQQSPWSKVRANKDELSGPPVIEGRTSRAGTPNTSKTARLSPQGTRRGTSSSPQGMRRGPSRVELVAARVGSAESQDQMLEGLDDHDSIKQPKPEPTDKHSPAVQSERLPRNKALHLSGQSAVLYESLTPRTRKKLFPKGHPSGLDRDEGTNYAYKPPPAPPPLPPAAAPSGLDFFASVSDRVKGILSGNNTPIAPLSPQISVQKDAYDA